MKRKVCIVGAGNVGATVAYTLVAQSIASEIVIVDINNEKSIGEAMDIKQGVFFCNPCKIYGGDYSDAKDSDIVIITCGSARKPGQTRIDLAQTNVSIMKSVIGEITKYAPDSIYIVVSNPVDILTYQFIKKSGISESKIIGTGTMLDTARLRTTISEHFKINQKNIHAYVFGEHGDSSFVPWSHATISNINIEDYNNAIFDPEDKLPPFDKDSALEYVKKSGGDIIEKKGATFYAVALCAAYICKSIFSRENNTMTVSSMLRGEYGISDVCLSTLCIVGERGIMTKLQPKLSDKELELLNISANKLKDVISQMNF